MNTKSLIKVSGLFVIFWILLGIIYPILVTIISQIMFPFQANGSLIKYDGKIIASKLICQPVNDPRFFWFRPSATSDYPCNPLSSGGSNIGPTNKALVKNIESRINILKKYNSNGPYPSDMILGSGSGLEPYISLQNALLQAKRVSKFSKIPYNDILKLIYKNLDNRTLSFIGAKRINVIKINLEILKWMKKGHYQKAY